MISLINKVPIKVVLKTTITESSFINISEYQSGFSSFADEIILNTSLYI